MSDCRKAKNSEISKVRQFQRALYCKAKQERKVRFHSLYDKIWRKDVLWEAWTQVRANRGAPGVDGKAIEKIVECDEERELIDRLHEQLREKRYWFSPVRRVDIPKANGGTRPLGIATVEDRVVQTAMKIVIEPIFEAGFHECSYGYRPKRNARQASQAIRNDLYQSRTWGVVEIDFKSYFTSIPHDRLMKLIALRISDGSLLKLIKATLKVSVAYEGRLEAVTIGVPQGSPLSPLYSNIYLNVLDQLWHAKGYPRKGVTMHRYADDIVLVCRSSGAYALAAFKELSDRLGLTVNEEKTKVTDLKRGFDFIGFEFVKRRSPNTGKSAIYIFPSRKSQENLRRKIRKLTRRRAPIKPDPFIEQINSVVRGWAEYFRYTNGAKVLRRLQGLINNRVRRFLMYRRKDHGFGFNAYPDEKLYKMGLIQIHSGWVKSS